MHESKRVLGSHQLPGLWNMLQNSLRHNSMCASQRFSFLGSPSNGPLSFFIVTFVAISLPLGLFFLSFYICLTLSFSLQISLKRQQTTAFILIASDSLPEPRRTIREHWSFPKAVVLGKPEQLTVEGNISRISDKRQMFSLSPSSTCSDINEHSITCQNVLI